jgi:hypothetical protein
MAQTITRRPREENDAAVTLGRTQTMPEKKIKDCARCGLEFTFERSTAKYCSDSCRRYVNITKQRKRIKRNTDRRILRNLQRRWRNLEGRRARYSYKRYDLMDDAEGCGGGSFAKDQLKQHEGTLKKLKPHWDRDEQTIRKDAEKLGVDWDRVAGADKPVNKKHSTSI